MSCHAQCECHVIINQSKFGFVKNDYFISDVNWAQVIENKDKLKFELSENMLKPIENIGGLKNQSAKNGE